MTLRGYVYPDGTVTLLRQRPSYDREQEWALDRDESAALRALLAGGGPKAACPTCGREIATRSDGTVRSHKRPYRPTDFGHWTGDRWCEGSRGGSP